MTAVCGIWRRATVSNDAYDDCRQIAESLNRLVLGGNIDVRAKMETNYEYAYSSRLMKILRNISNRVLQQVDLVVIGWNPTTAWLCLS